VKLIKACKYGILVPGFFLVCLAAGAQIDLASNEAMLVEQQNINFQTFFFEALQQKAIGNHEKAIYALEACNDIEKQNKAVLFELSKNYFLLFKYTEAEYYILSALENDPKNIHMLRHLKEIKTRQNDYSGAISIQERIVDLHPEEESELVLLFIKSGEIDKATELLRKLDSSDKLPEGLAPLKESLLHEGGEQTSPPVSDDIRLTEEPPQSRTELLKETYENKRDYSSLKQLLDRELKTKEFLELLRDSKDGLDLFPAQPYVYLMHAKALNSLRKYGEAIDILEQGMEFLIEDDAMQAEFLEELSLSHKGLGDNKKASQYYQKAMELKNE
jgi:predicted Zn-dependent protease